MSGQCNAFAFLCKLATQRELLEQIRPNTCERLENLIYGGDTKPCNRAVFFCKLLNDPRLREVLLELLTKEQRDEMFSALWAHYPQGA
ncbi:hypothetical protein QR680_013635 [Steinernema hermaphroditum]|uniref:Uncharacterized protein n=1 Tax=Steinernema hermaphroditum TaxID=289476 RepID=A0AA39I657_9BILA|nr:hypothetical protein QR680_013635 [Steinernema hermaphroditum]